MYFLINTKKSQTIILKAPILPPLLQPLSELQWEPGSYFFNWNVCVIFQELEDSDASITRQSGKMSQLDICWILQETTVKNNWVESSCAFFTCSLRAMHLLSYIHSHFRLLIKITKFHPPIAPFSWVIPRLHTLSLIKLDANTAWHTKTMLLSGYR